MGLPLWREPEEDAPRRSTTRSPTHPVIARSPIAHSQPRRRDLREYRERRLRELLNSDDDDDDDNGNDNTTVNANASANAGRDRLRAVRARFFEPAPSFAVESYAPPRDHLTQDARLLDQAVSYLTQPNTVLNWDTLTETRGREPSAEGANARSNRLAARVADSDDRPVQPGLAQVREDNDAYDWPPPAPRSQAIRFPGRQRVPLSRTRRRQLMNAASRDPVAQSAQSAQPAQSAQSAQQSPRSSDSSFSPAWAQVGGRHRGVPAPDRHVDGLGDRDRSLSPDGLWDNLLTTLTPDPQPPSVGSSFASASASTSASQNPTAASSRTSVTNPAETVEPPCDPVSEEGSGERDTNDVNRLMAELGESGPEGNIPDDMAWISGMHSIIRRLASREDIPDSWWEQAGLSRSMSWEAAEGDN
ncbi:hypothetical protein F5B19DRAFT_477355 [Rostrohypoxylon terebratum]|nr:hypothetical protein F5B19DRAFT_477355 [Rostrohypoxylon terebratum]